jgi:SAM-dependent methyltransferase
VLTIDFRHFPLRSGERLLDLGCGEGRHAINSYLQGDVEVFGVDLSERDLRTATERFAPYAQPGNPQKFFALQLADGARLPFADHSFDKVICSEVLEHIHDYQSILREIQRVLKPGGQLAVSVPRTWPERVCWHLSREYHQVEGGHIRIFNARELRRDIEARRMQHYHRHWAHALHAPFWWLKCLLWQRQEQSRLIRLYHRLLVWDLMERPWLTRTLERLLNPLLGKSVVMYFEHIGAEPSEGHKS